jgi:hypothetical protein
MLIAGVYIYNSITSFVTVKLISLLQKSSFVIRFSKWEFYAS